MKLTKGTREECFKTLHGCSGNIKNAYLYLKDNKRYEKYFFDQLDDFIIKNGKNCKKRNYYQKLIKTKGEDCVKERETFNFFKIN